MHLMPCKNLFDANNVFGVFLHSKKTKRRFDVQKYIFARQILQIYLMPKCILAYILRSQMFSTAFWQRKEAKT